MNRDNKLLEALKDHFNIEEVKDLSIVLKDAKGGFYEKSFGDAFMLNGMLDFAKRTMFLKTLAMHDKHKKYKLEELE